MSDTAVKAAVDAVSFIGRTLSEISAESFRNLENETLGQVADALERGAITDAEILAQLGACNMRQGFNLFHLLISPAHAAVTCRVETNDGQVIHFTREEVDQCLELYLAIGERDPSRVQEIVSGLPVASAFAQALGNLAAFASGPVVLGETEEGELFTAVDERGRYLYRNSVTGIYFYANPADSRDVVTVGTALELATVVAAATRTVVRGVARMQGGGEDKSAWTQISSDSRAIIRSIERHSGIMTTRTQRQRIADQVRQRDHREPASNVEYLQLQRAFDSARNRLRNEWTQNTGQKWPVDASGRPFQAHHIIPTRYGGPNTWWNLHPVPRASHQIGVHGSGSATQSVFPTPVPR